MNFALRILGSVYELFSENILFPSFLFCSIDVILNIV